MNNRKALNSGLSEPCFIQDIMSPVDCNSKKTQMHENRLCTFAKTAESCFSKDEASDD